MEQTMNGATQHWYLENCPHRQCQRVITRWCKCSDASIGSIKMMAYNTVKDGGDDDDYEVVVVVVVMMIMR